MRYKHLDQMLPEGAFQAVGGPIGGKRMRLYGDGGGGGGGGGNVPADTTVSNLSPFLQPYAGKLLGKGEALTDISQNPYQPYGSQRIAGFNPLQYQALSNIGMQQTPNQYATATGLSGLAGTKGLNIPQYTGANVRRFMTPYMENVVRQQQMDAIRTANMTNMSRNQAAAAQGTYGGARHALDQAERERNLQFQLGDIRAKGLQNAFQNAQQQFNTSVGQGLQGGQLANQAAQQLLGAGQQQLAADTGINQLQYQAGAAQQAQEQALLSQQYQDFINQKNYPYQNLSYMSSLIRGLPAAGDSTVYRAPPSTISQAAGLLGGGAGLLGAYNAYNRGASPAGAARGGKVQGYKRGGGIAEAMPKRFAMGGGMPSVDGLAGVEALTSDQNVQSKLMMAPTSYLQKVSQSLPPTSPVKQQADAILALRARMGSNRTAQTQLAEQAGQLPSMSAAQPGIPPQMGGAATPPGPGLPAGLGQQMAGGGVVALDEGGTAEERSGVNPFGVETWLPPVIAGGAAIPWSQSWGAAKHMAAPFVSRIPGGGGGAGPFGVITGLGSIFTRAATNAATNPVINDWMVSTGDPDNALGAAIIAATRDNKTKPASANPSFNTPPVPANNPTNEELGRKAPGRGTPGAGSKPGAGGAAGVKTSASDDLFADYKKRLEAMDREGRENAKGDLMLRLAQTGFKIAGGTSPYAAVNIGQGASEGLGDYIKDVSAARAAQRQNIKDLAELDKARRELDIKAFEAQARMLQAQRTGIHAPNSYEVLHNLYKTDPAFVNLVVGKGRDPFMEKLMASPSWLKVQSIKDPVKQKQYVDNLRQLFEKNGTIGTYNPDTGGIE